MTVNYAVDIIVNNKPVTTYSHEGDTFIEGRPKSEYKIRIRNYENRRIKVVVSVDGLSIIDGEPASESSTGYVIAAYHTMEIEGWRVDDAAVRKFVFGSKKNSFSNKTGHGVLNTGVIGVMAFKEKPTYTGIRGPIYWHDTNAQPFITWGNTHGQNDINLRGISMNSAQVVGSIQLGATSKGLDAMYTQALNNVATEQGEEIASAVSSTTFTAESTLATTKVIYYDDVKGLEARGIQVKKAIPASPNPFPASKTYCKRV